MEERFLQEDLHTFVTTSGTVSFVFMALILTTNIRNVTKVSGIAL